MRDPAREKKGHVGPVEVQRIEVGVGEETTSVVQGHEHHDQTAQQIDRVEPGRGLRHRLGDASRGGHWGLHPLSLGRACAQVDHPIRRKKTRQDRFKR